MKQKTEHHSLLYPSGSRIQETPMMKQYHSIKRKYSDAILLFRLGDFYEMFENDAVVASSLLNIALTRRNKVRMCGFPYHAAENYISRLLKAGKRIAICEQTENPKQAKGIVRREVVEVISPGIVSNPDLLERERYNCIASLYGIEQKDGPIIAVASCDISTGYYVTALLEKKDYFDSLLNEIDNNGIHEIVFPESMEKDGSMGNLMTQIKQLRSNLVLRLIEDSYFDYHQSSILLKEHFGVATLDVFEFAHEVEIITAGALLSWIKDNIKKEIPHVQWIQRRRKEEFLILDSATKRHLELTENQIDGGKEATLFSILDKTKTAMGGRLLRWYIHNPSRNCEEIRYRLARVEFFLENSAILEKVRGYLDNILDIERIIAKFSVGKGTPRDLIGLRNSLHSVEKIVKTLKGQPLFRDLIDEIFDFRDIVKLISSAIVDDPPASYRDGSIIRSGYDSLLDEYRQVRRENREWINNYQAGEQTRLGIPSLKVKYNKVIGYYIEVTKANLNNIPSNYLRKQTLVNAERFTTEELEMHEAKLSEAREQANEREYELFLDISHKILGRLAKLFSLSASIARIDLFASLAWVALENNYVKPEITEENVVEIRGGRHPVIEKFLDTSFIDNDLYLDDSEQRVMILTGPNMAGKSTYLRQSALIVVMAHMGSYVPAKYAKIGRVDRLFSRIGMVDRLVKGESTFLVEMIETSRILHYATQRSFIIMDEIGRGTSTYDGLAIAWSVLEYLLNQERAGSKVLFATHYHEITALGNRYGVVNYNVAVREWNHEVVFLRKVVLGNASKSYGVEVARLAGIPKEVIERAKELLSRFERQYGSYISLLAQEEEKNKISGQRIEEETTSHRNNYQLDLFPSPYEIITKELRELDINTITPLEALNLLDKLKKSIFF